jgi:hypothetical protein
MVEMILVLVGDMLVVMRVHLLVADDLWMMVMIVFENVDHFVDEMVKFYHVVSVD